MTNRKMIEEAAQAILGVEGCLGTARAQQFALAALAVFEKAHTPTDDEREALNTLYWTHPDGHTTGLTPDAIEAVLAAGFRRSEVPEPSTDTHELVEGVHYKREGNRIVLLKLPIDFNYVIPLD